ncbi:nuclear receptor coactivator 5 isoform X2 [Latimeria chalumnae]|nr:PREDICTED: nuclear receptor coactivator 5-like isoform X2 [Latimeria chalumnae]|eukprot:XP_005996426.1 PREDICTED: nuclear receptor coactivator 5-like isoform X2 [Latimeria chalumnae]
MSSWVRVTKGQVQKSVPEKSAKNRAGRIPQLLSIPSQKSYQTPPYSVQEEIADAYSKHDDGVEDLFNRLDDYSSGIDDRYERFQYSQTDEVLVDHRGKLYEQFYIQLQDEYDKEKPADCVVVSMSKQQSDYETAIGHRLQYYGLTVELIYISTESSLTHALQEVRNDGSPFCILIEQSNITLSSCTVIIFHGALKIHRNMPTEDALTLIAGEHQQILADRVEWERNEIARKAADLADDYLERERYESYKVPITIKHLLFLLSKGKFLYPDELKSISDYLKTRIDEQEGPVEQAGLLSEVDTTQYLSYSEASSSTAPDSLSKVPPPLLPTPSRAPLLGHSPHFQTSLLQEPGTSAVSTGVKNKAQPLLGISAKPGLLGYAPLLPVKPSLFGGKPTPLLPTPVAPIRPVKQQWAVKRKHPQN